MWFLWGLRNKLMHERKIELGRELSMKVLRYLAKIDGLTERRNTLNTVRSANQRDRNPKVMIYFDAAFNRRDFKSMIELRVAWLAELQKKLNAPGRRGTALPSDDPGG
ncbi:hypothetical protein Goshw_011452 [Gossypium schwendimanii]|uniref:Uncharacterized protein n=1 Tax=Gossypium schwendimanii TaxID=34291 RepID=A0A7J9MC01_GOSSC|nr:hypothetical protein [Gossypium schwendimanii]